MQFCVNLDMDGVIAGLYDIPDWLEKLKAEDASPYLEAKPLINLSLLARYLNKIQKMGFEIAIISWTSKNSSDEYHKAVQMAKLEWLAEHLPSVAFNRVSIVPYGTPKSTFCYHAGDILIDDEERNRACWNGASYPETAIFDVLKELVRGN